LKTLLHEKHKIEKGYHPRHKEKVRPEVPGVNERLQQRKKATDKQAGEPSPELTHPVAVFLSTMAIFGILSDNVRGTYSKGTYDYQEDD
jgi:hypothetical protein